MVASETVTIVIRERMAGAAAVDFRRALSRIIRIRSHDTPASGRAGDERYLNFRSKDWIRSSGRFAPAFSFPMYVAIRGLNARPFFAAGPFLKLLADALTLVPSASCLSSDRLLARGVRRRAGGAARLSGS